MAKEDEEVARDESHHRTHGTDISVELIQFTFLMRFAFVSFISFLSLETMLKTVEMIIVASDVKMKCLGL